MSTEASRPQTSAGRRGKRVPLDPTPRFKIDREMQCDVVLGHLDSQVSQEHLARSVWSIMAGVDTESVERGYSALGRRGYPPRRLLALWVYASLVGEHEASKVARRCESDSAFRWLCGGHTPSAATLKRFRYRHGALFASALQYTVDLAVELDLVDAGDLAVDSVRLRAHASRDAVRTVKRSTKRVTELRAQLETTDDATQVQTLTEQLENHERALARCKDEGVSKVVLTNESAALMKFPHGTSAPAHRATVTAAGLQSRIVLSVLVDASTHDYGKLVPALADARTALCEAGHPNTHAIVAAADAGYFSRATTCWPQPANTIGSTSSSHLRRRTSELACSARPPATCAKPDGDTTPRGHRCVRTPIHAHSGHAQPGKTTSKSPSNRGDRRRTPPLNQDL